MAVKVKEDGLGGARVVASAGPDVAANSLLLTEYPHAAAIPIYSAGGSFIILTPPPSLL